MRRIPSARRLPARSAIPAVLLLSFTSGLWAQSTWTGGAHNSDFDSAGNWSPAPPAPGDAALFNGIVGPDGMPYPSGIVLLPEGGRQVYQLIIRDDSVALEASGGSATLDLGSGDPGQPGLVVADGLSGYGELRLSRVNVMAANASVGAGTGSNGSLILESGGSLSVPGTLWLGGPGGGSGTLDIRGWGTIQAGAIHVSSGSALNLPLGYVSTGELHVASGGVLNLSGGSLSPGAVLFEGGSTINWTGGQLGLDNLSIGLGGIHGLPPVLTGNMELSIMGTTVIESGTTLTVAGTWPWGGGSMFYFSPVTFRTGQLEVQPGGAIDFQSGGLEMGAQDLELGPMGLLKDPLDVWGMPNVTGDLTLEGNRALSVGGTTTIRAGATLAIRGGIFYTRQLLFDGGRLEFESGNLGLGQDLIVGWAGTLGDGDVTLGWGRNLYTEGATSIRDGTTLELNGGSLRARAIETGSGTFRFTAGTLGITGPEGFQVGDAGTLGAGDVTLSDWQSVEGGVTVRDGATLTIDGGSLDCDWLTVDSGQVRLQRGYMTLRQDLAVGPGEPLGASIHLGDGTNLNVYATLTVASGGSVALHGGSLFTYGLGVQAGGMFSFDSGELSVYPSLQIGPASPLGTSLILDPARRLNVYGTLTVEGGSSLALAGGNIRTYQLDVDPAGTLTYSSGNANLGLLLNAGQVTVNLAGASRTLDADVVNNGSFLVEGGPGGELTVDGAFTNNAGFKATDVTVRFLGTFTNNGAYRSDPSKSFFNRLDIGPEGYLQGGQGDQFIILGDLVNQSTRPEWNTLEAELIFQGAGPHQFENPPGHDTAWGTLVLESGGSLEVVGGPLFVRELHLADGSSQLDSIHAPSVRIYYDPAEPANAYLLGYTYGLNGGGSLGPGVIPEPAMAGLLLAAAALGLGRRGRAGR